MPACISLTNVGGYGRERGLVVDQAQLEPLSNYTELSKSLLIYDLDEWLLTGRNKMPSQQAPLTNFTLTEITFIYEYQNEAKYVEHKPLKPLNALFEAEV